MKKKITTVFLTFLWVIFTFIGLPKYVMEKSYYYHMKFKVLSYILRFTGIEFMLASERHLVTSHTFSSQQEQLFAQRNKKHHKKMMFLNKKNILRKWCVKTKYNILCIWWFYLILRDIIELLQINIIRHSYHYNK